MRPWRAAWQDRWRPGCMTGCRISARKCRGRKEAGAIGTRTSIGRGVGARKRSGKFIRPVSRIRSERSERKFVGAGVSVRITAGLAYSRRMKLRRKLTVITRTRAHLWWTISHSHKRDHSPAYSIRRIRTNSDCKKYHFFSPQYFCSNHLSHGSVPQNVMITFAQFESRAIYINIGT